MARRINEVIEGIRKGMRMTREDLAERMGQGTTLDELNKHFENDSADGWRIARMCEIFHLPTIPSSWYLKELTEDSKR